MQFKFIDLFCGLGGFRIAFENIGCECVFSSDIDKHVREVYKLNFGELPHGDITKIDEKDIPTHDILCAGFPCQPFSIGGKRLGFEDTRGTLFFDVLRITKEKQPKVVFLENVAGLSNHDKGKTMETIISCLKEIDYIPFFKIINAKDVGYPQNRSRWYCVAFNKKIFSNIDENYKFPFPQKKNLKYKIESLFETNVNIKYTITEICKFNIQQHVNEFIKSSRFNNENVLIANEVRKSRCGFRCDGISPCLTAKMGTGGNNIPVIVTENRKFTERECLRIMGYPDTYKIQSNYHQSYKQIGNSVVVPIIEDIAKEILSCLKEIN